MLLPACSNDSPFRASHLPICPQLAEAEELEAAIAAEREEAEALRAQLGHLESQTAAQVWRMQQLDDAVSQSAGWLPLPQ